MKCANEIINAIDLTNIYFTIRRGYTGIDEALIERYIGP